MASSKNKNDFACTECGWTAVKWVGRCGECQAWGTVQEVGSSSGIVKKAKPAVILETSMARPITQVSSGSVAANPTGVGEFDRVLGGGLVAGAVVLLLSLIHI